MNAAVLSGQVNQISPTELIVILAIVAFNAFVMWLFFRHG